MTAEAWELGSGLNLDGADTIVTDLEFGFNAKIGVGVVCANFTLTNEEDGEEIEQSFSVGKNFEASSDGSELEGAGKINKNTNFGVLLASIVDVFDGDIDAVIEVLEDPKVAANWIGTRWTWGSIERDTVNPSTGVAKKSTNFIATAFNGRAEDEAPAAKSKAPAAKKAAATTTKKAAASTKAAPAPAEEPDSDSTAPDGVEQELWDTLVELAGQHEDHADFADAAMDVEGVEGNRVLTKAVMSTKAGSVWAAAK